MNLSGKRIFVVDAYGLIYQRFHALPSYMTGRNGEPVNAIYGFIQDLFILLETQSVDILFCAFDLHAPTLRSQMYAEYKATREKMPEELIAQIPKIREMLEALRIPILAQEGYEGDDILATVSRMTVEAGGECVLVTNDKDSRQLISDAVSIFNLRKNLYVDREYVRNDWGIEPEQVIDYQALVGDSADNVPGIALIGPKAARDLLGRFGTLEEVLKPENLDAFYGKKPSKRRDNLLNGAETARLCQNLVRLEQHVPMEVDWTAGETRNFDFGALRPIFNHYNFKSLMTKVAALGKKNGTWSKDTDEMCTENGSGKICFETSAETSEEASEETSAGAKNDTLNMSMFTESSVFQDSIQTRITLPIFEGRYVPEEEKKVLILPPVLFSDVNFAQLGGGLGDKTSVTNPAEGAGQADMFGLFGKQEEKKTEILPKTQVDNALKRFLDENRTLLVDADTVKVGFNLKRLRNLLRSIGFSLSGPQFDVMVAAYILEPDGKHNTLLELVDAFPRAGLGAGAVSVIAPDGIETESEAFQRRVLENLFHIQTEALRGAGLDTVCFGLEFPLMEVLAEMEFQGIFLQKLRMAEISQQFKSRIEAVSAELYQMIEAAEREAGVARSESEGKLNLNSPVQLRKLLFETLKLTSTRKTKTGLSTDAHVLEELAAQHPFPGRLLEYRQMVKLQNTYVEALPRLISPRDGRIHTTFNQTVTATGRLSSSEPNLQNIPVRSEEGRLIRSVFVPEKAEDGWRFVSADYSQIELRVLAHYCGDRNLCEAFLQEQDIHARVASQIHGIALEDVTPAMRRVAKMVNFGVIYGQSSFGLASQLKIPQSEARDFIQAYFQQFPAIPSFLETVIEFARLNGFVCTLFGRRRALQGIRTVRRGQLNTSERMAVNTVIQGSAADLIKLAMLHVYDRLRRENLRSRFLLQIHDELLLECPPEEIATVKTILEEEMTSAWTLSVPLKVDAEVNETW